jgi:hypothetical protein
MLYIGQILGVWNGKIQFTLFQMRKFNSEVEPSPGTDCAGSSRFHCNLDICRYSIAYLQGWKRGPLWTSRLSCSNKGHVFPSCTTAIITGTGSLCAPRFVTPVAKCPGSASLITAATVWWGGFGSVTKPSIRKRVCRIETQVSRENQKVQTRYPVSRDVIWARKTHLWPSGFDVL